MQTKPVIAVFVLAVILTTPIFGATRQTADNTNPVLLVPEAVWNGTQDSPQKDYVVLLLGGRIESVGRMPALEALQQETGAQVEALNNFLSTHTVLETLLFMNSDNQVKHDMDFYFRLAQFSEPWDWAGPDLVADWFRRNMRIYGNIAGLVKSPRERVLVLYGAGHLGWLQFAFDNNQNIRLRKLAEFVD